MAEIDASLISKDELVRLLKEAQDRVKQETEARELEKKTLEENVKKLREALNEHQVTLDKVRFPGIDLETLPSLGDIAQQLGQDQTLLEYYLDKKPDKFLMLVDNNVAGQVSALKMKIKDAEVDISGNSTIELIDDQDELFWSKYDGTPATIDNDFVKNFAKVKDTFYKMKNQYVEERRYVADISNLQDCRMSAYLHFRKRQNDTTELVAVVEEKKEDEEVTKLKQVVELLKKEIEDMKKNKDDSMLKEAEEQAQKDQEKLAQTGTEQMPVEEEEEETPEEPVSDEIEERKPKRGRQRG